MPLVLHYSGHRADAPGRQPARLPARRLAEVQRQIAQTLDKLRPEIAFGALASGSDILFAEALLERGVALHIVLPLPVDEFVRMSVADAEGAWQARFEQCWRAAASQRITAQRVGGHEAEVIAFGSHVAMGLALLQAQLSGTTAYQSAVWDGRSNTGAAGTAADVATWRCAGAEQQFLLLTAETPEQILPSSPQLCFSVGAAHYDSLAKALAIFVQATCPVYLDAAAHRDELVHSAQDQERPVSTISERAAALIALLPAWRPRLQQAGSHYGLKTGSAVEKS